jgi:hypothetical protein
MFKFDDKGWRNIVSNNKRFHLHIFNQEQADKLVSKLNDIVRNPEISTNIANYHNIQKRKEDTRRRFDEQLTNLMNGIKLKARVLRGKCDHCY